MIKAAGGFFLALATLLCSSALLLYALFNWVNVFDYMVCWTDVNFTEGFSRTSSVRINLKKATTGRFLIMDGSVINSIQDTLSDFDQSTRVDNLTMSCEYVKRGLAEFLVNNGFLADVEFH